MLFDGILSTCMIDSVSLKTHQSITNLMSVKVVIKNVITKGNNNI